MREGKYDFDEENIVLSVAAFSDVHCSGVSRGKKMAAVMRKAREMYPALDAYLFAGDMGEAQPRTEDKPWLYPELSCFAEYAAMGNDARLPVVWCLGNHDGPAYALQAERVDFRSVGNDRPYTVTRGMTGLDAVEAVMRDNAPETFFSTDPFPVPTSDAPRGFRYSLIRGYHFFAVDHSYADEETAAWLAAQLTAVTEKEPEKTVFVISHMPSESVECPMALRDCLSAFPQVLYIAGHTHIHVTDHIFVSSNAHSQVILGTCNHASRGLNIPHPKYYHYQMKQGAVLEIDGAGRVRVTGIDYSFEEQPDGTLTSTLNEDGVVADRPLRARTVVFGTPSADAAAPILFDSGTHSTEDERYFKPYFAEDAAITFGEETEEGLPMTFSTARAANFIKRYYVTVTDLATGAPKAVYDPLAERATEVLALGSDHILYGTYGHIPATQTVKLIFPGTRSKSRSALVSIVGCDDFNNLTPPLYTRLPKE